MAHILNIDKLLSFVIITFFTCSILGTESNVKLMHYGCVCVLI